jgi:hypothetical protein
MRKHTLGAGVGASGAVGAASGPRVGLLVSRVGARVGDLETGTTARPQNEQP